MIDKLKQEIIQINASLYELEKRKESIQVYIQGYEESRKESETIENTLQEKIKELEDKIGSV